MTIKAGTETETEESVFSSSAPGPRAKQKSAPLLAGLLSHDPVGLSGCRHVGQTQGAKQAYGLWPSLLSGDTAPWKGPHLWPCRPRPHLLGTFCMLGP